MSGAESRASLLHLVLCVLPLACPPVLWGMVFGLTKPHAQAVLGLDERQIGSIMILAPLSGATAPITGILIDKFPIAAYKSRAFVLLGAALFAIGAWLQFGLAPGLVVATSAADVAADTNPPQLGAARLGFFLMAVAGNIVIVASQTLLGSALPAAVDRMRGQSLGGSLGALGGLSVNLLIFALEDPVRDAAFFATVICSCVGGALLLTCLAVPEIVQADPSPAPGPAKEAGSKGLARVLELVGETRECFVLAMLGICSLFAWMPTNSTFFGRCVFLGDPHAPAGSEAALRFTEGVRASGLSISLHAALRGLTTAKMPVILALRGARATFAVSLLAFGFGLFVLSQATAGHPMLATIIVMLLGIPNATLMFLPMALLGTMVKNPREKGLAFGLLNLAIVIPQMVVIGINRVLLSYGDERLTLVLSTLVAVVAAAAGHLMLGPKHDTLLGLNATKSKAGKTPSEPNDIDVEPKKDK